MARLRGTLTVVCALAALLAAALAPGTAWAASTNATVTISTDQQVSQAPFMGLGVELDPYDSVTPTPAQWALIFQRLDFMHPGFLRVVEPASDYFSGSYGAGGVPIYRWTAPHVQQLLTILGYAQSRGIPVVLGDWSNPIVGGNASVPVDFIADLRNQYGFTVLDYYDPMNEPNDDGPGCPFSCWTSVMSSLSQAFAAAGLQGVVKLTGPDDANSWDDTQTAQSADRAHGLDGDNPPGGDGWVTLTLQSIPSLIGAYDSHRYATVWGIENGVYEDQMRARRQQIDNLDSPLKSYFAGEVGMTARQVTPFFRTSQAWRTMLDPSFRGAVSSFVDSQPNIEQFAYGAWMGDMAIQGLDAGLSGESAWDLDDAMHTGGGYGSQNLKQWGFWNLLGGQDGYPASDLAPRPWYDAWAVMSRAFPAGAQVLLTPSTGVPGVRVAAAKTPAGGRDYLSFALVNDSGGPATVRLTVPSAMHPVTLARYDYFSGDDPTDANGLPVPAQTLSGVQLSSGLTVQLPSQGQVVLTSLGAGAAAPLSRGLHTMLDPLTGWRATRSHARHLVIDRTNPSLFDDDPARALVAPKTKKTQFLIYRAHQISSFQLSAYYVKTLGLRVYSSPDGTSWTPVPLASTNPAPTLGGGWFLDQLTPAAPIPADTNRLELVLSGRATELGQVQISSDRVGPACLAHRLAVGSGQLAGIPLGAGHARVHWLYGAATSNTRSAWSYCVIGGGQVSVVFTRRSGAELIATTSTGLRVGGIGPGSSVAALRRSSRRLGLRAIRSDVLAAGQLVVLTQAGRVHAVAVAAPSVLKSSGSLLHALRLAGL